LGVGNSIVITTTTIDTIQDIRTTATPEFAGLTLTGLSGVLKATAGVVSGSATLDDISDGTSYERVAANQLDTGVYIDATTTTKGIASFSNTYFSVTNGAVSLIAGGGLNHSDLGNLDYASAGHTGFEPTVTKGNLTETTSSVLTIGSGTGAVIGSGTTIQVTVASSGTDGYLSGTDWDTFNSKQAGDAGLTALAALTVVSDSVIKATATDTYEIRTLAEIKSDLSLNLVENTALSTWAGTTNITTLGTIATGTWQATDVGIAYGGTGQSTAQLAINALTAVAAATNEHVLTKDTATGNAIFKVAAGGGTPGGADPQIQYNNGGAFGGVSILNFDDVNTRLGIGTATPTYFIDVEKTLAAGAAGYDFAMYLDVTGSATSATGSEYCLKAHFNAGYTGGRQSIALLFANYSAGTGADALNTAGLNYGNYGFFGTCRGTTTGDNVGGSAYAQNGDKNYGGSFWACTDKNNAINVGLIGRGLNSGTGATQVGGYFGLQLGTPTFTSAALIADNGTQTNPIFLGRDNGTIVFAINDGGKVGIGTSTVPHEAVGSAKLAIEGTNASMTVGPHIQITTSSNNYPLFQMRNYSHDNIALVFDAYNNTAGQWRSSDAGSNFMIHKVSDTFNIKYDSGVAAGGTPTWNTGFTLNTAGGILMPGLKSGATQAAAGAAANELWVTSGHATQEDNTVMMGV